MPDFTELKQKHRTVWASGDYDQIARGIQVVADHVVRSGVSALASECSTLPAAPVTRHSWPAHAELWSREL